MDHLLFIVILLKGYIPVSKVNNIEIGRLGEEIACREIRKRGYRIIERNYKSRLGEIDLIAMDGDVLVFIEIKTRRSSIDYAKEAIDKRKRKRLSKLALAYIKAKRYDNIKVRFDVIAISIKNNKPYIEVIKDAFWLED